MNPGLRLGSALLALLLCIPAAAEPPAPYYVVFLRPDSARTPITPEEGKRIMAAHMANIQSMADQGIMVAAGPFDDEHPTISGIFVFGPRTLAEAQRIAASDPTVMQRRNTADVHPWFGPEGIGTAYFSWVKQHPDAKTEMASHTLVVLNRSPGVKTDPKLAAAHEAFIGRCREKGVLAAAGGVDDASAISWIGIFKADSRDEAAKILQDDPLIRSGQFTAEYHRWWTADRVLPW